MTALLLLCLALDGGLPAGVTVDAGTVDAGPVTPTPPWAWETADGGFLDPDGTTDVLTLKLGATAHVRLARPIVLMQCDDELLTLGATDDELLLTAVKRGETRCGFWYTPNAIPHRYMRVTVKD